MGTQGVMNSYVSNACLHPILHISSLCYLLSTYLQYVLRVKQIQPTSTYVSQPPGDSGQEGRLRKEDGASTAAILDVVFQYPRPSFHGLPRQVHLWWNRREAEMRYLSLTTVVS